MTGYLRRDKRASFFSNKSTLMAYRSASEEQHDLREIDVLLDQLNDLLEHVLVCRHHEAHVTKDERLKSWKLN